jgi:hypothetical protein
MMLKAQTFADDHPLIIEKVEVRLFRMPPSVPWEDATHRVPAIEIIVLELTVNGRLWASVGPRSGHSCMIIA